MTLNDADIPDSITRALFDALQEKRTWNQLPATMTVLAHVGGAQLQPWLATEGNHQVRSSLLPKFHGEPYVIGYLESTEYAVSAKINDSRSGLTPTVESRNKGTSRPTTWQLEWYGNHRTVAQLSTS